MAPRLNLAQLPFLAVMTLAGCSSSHEAEALGSAGGLRCVAYLLTLDWGTSVEVHRASRDGLGDSIEIPIAEGGGDQRFSAVTTHDLDRDGLRDVAIRDAYGGAALLEESVTLTILWGADVAIEDRERTRFTGGTPITAGGGIDALGDWDGDSVPDLVASFSHHVLLGGREPVETSDRCESGAAVGDVDGDGVGDTACIAAPSTLLLRFGGATPARTRELVMEGEIGGIRPAGDVDGDGVPELLIGYAGSSRLLRLSDGAAIELDTPFDNLWAVGDVNADGKGDVVTRRDGALHLARGGEGVLAVDDAPFERADGDSRTIAAWGDVDCDGRSDVIVRRPISGGPDQIALHRGTEWGLETAPSWTRTIGDGSLVPIYD